MKKIFLALLLFCNYSFSQLDFDLSLSLGESNGIAFSFDPTNYGTPIVWLKNATNISITSGNIVGWGDNSGNGNDFEAISAPAYNLTGMNGFPVADFNGTTNYFENVGSFKPKYFCEIAIFSTPDSANAGVLTQTYAGSVGTIWGGFNFAAVGHGKFASYNSDGTGYTTTTTTISCVLGSYNTNVGISKYIDGETTHHIWVNNVSQGVADLTTSASTNNGTPPTYVIGRYGNLNAFYFNGRLSEYLLYGGNLITDIPTDGQIATISAYYQNKFTYVAPRQDHWYYFGDSITYGSLASPITLGWSYLLSLFEDVFCDDRGVGGQSLITFLSSTITIPPPVNSNEEIFFSWGVNDTSDSDTATYRTNYNLVLADAITKGWTYDQMTITTGWYGIPYATYPNFVYVANNICSQHSIKKFDHVSRAYDLDGIHPSTIGHDTIYLRMSPYY